MQEKNELFERCIEECNQMISSQEEINKIKDRIDDAINSLIEEPLESRQLITKKLESFRKEVSYLYADRKYKIASKYYEMNVKKSTFKLEESLKRFMVATMDKLEAYLQLKPNDLSQNQEEIMKHIREGHDKLTEMLTQIPSKSEAFKVLQTRAKSLLDHSGALLTTNAQSVRAVSKPAALSQENQESNGNLSTSTLPSAPFPHSISSSVKVVKKETRTFDESIMNQWHTPSALQTLTKQTIITTIPSHLLKAKLLYGLFLKQVPASDQSMTDAEMNQLNKEFEKTKVLLFEWKTNRTSVTKGVNKLTFQGESEFSREMSTGAFFSLVENIGPSGKGTTSLMERVTEYYPMTPELLKIPHIVLDYRRLYTLESSFEIVYQLWEMSGPDALHNRKNLVYDNYSGKFDSQKLSNYNGNTEFFKSNAPSSKKTPKFESQELKSNQSSII